MLHIHVRIRPTGKKGVLLPTLIQRDAHILKHFLRIPEQTPNSSTSTEC